MKWNDEREKKLLLLFLCWSVLALLFLFAVLPFSLIYFLSFYITCVYFSLPFLLFQHFLTLFSLAFLSSQAWQSSLFPSTTFSSLSHAAFFLSFSLSKFLSDPAAQPQYQYTILTPFGKQASKFYRLNFNVSWAKWEYKWKWKWWQTKSKSRRKRGEKEFIWFMAYKCAIFSLLTVRRLWRLHI